MNDYFWCGVQSGYPLCCIDFFINFWCPVRKNHFMFSGRPECYDWESDVEYVQCPQCIVKGLRK